MKRKTKTLRGRILVITLSVIMTMSSFTFSSAAAAQTISVQNPFTDLTSGSYYYDAVLWAYSEGITSGTTASTFSPSSTCTRGQVVTFLWRALGKPSPASSSNPFKDVKQGDYYYDAVLWAVEKGITEGTDASSFSPEMTCTSAHVLTFLWRANDKPAAVSQSAIASSYPGQYYTEAAAWADAGGLLSGLGKAFIPSSNSPRSDIVTYLYRNAGSPAITEVSSSASSGGLDSEQIYAKCSPAVFIMKVYDASGNIKGSGSGFFISSDGTAITNFHVIDGKSSATIVTSDTGKEYKVKGVYAYSADEDWALVKIDGSGFKYLEIETAAAAGGAPIYAIGSPLGLENTITEGIVSNPKRVEDGTEYIQISAAISPGSSGGALLNRFGKVIGITTASYTDGQNLNLAVPISKVKTASKSSITPLSSIPASKNSSSSSSTFNTANEAMKELIRKNANTTVEFCPAITKSTTDNNGEDVYYAIYYTKENEPTYCHEWVTGNYVYSTALIVGPDTSYFSIDEYAVGQYSSSLIASGGGYFQTATFGEYSSDLVFTKTDGFKTNEIPDVADLTTALLVETVSFIDELYKQYCPGQNISIKDLGFRALAQ